MKLSFLFILLFSAYFGSSQSKTQETPSPVKWSFNLVKSANNSAEFLATADISKGWNIYSVYMGEDGPVPTSFSFDNIDGGILKGKIVEKSHKISAFDELFSMEVIKFKEKAEFSQLLDGQNISLKGTVMYMCCDSQRCLPPTSVPFALKL
jgi:hypothetical protein